MMDNGAQPLADLEWIAFDADDTLWDNEPFFFAAEAELERILAPYTDLRGEALTLAVYEREKRNLGIFGYGAKGFTLSMIETAIEVSDGRITGREVRAILEQGKRLMQYPIRLLEGVAEVLPELRNRYRLVVITKGDLFDQESKLARSGLAWLFRGVEIVSDKNAGVYREIAQKYGMDPGRTLMVGNSLRSDILPALEAGWQAAHVPGNASWVHEQAEPPEGARFLRLRTLWDLPGHLAPAL